MQFLKNMKYSLHLFESNWLVSLGRVLFDVSYILCHWGPFIYYVNTSRGGGGSENANF